LVIRKTKQTFSLNNFTLVVKNSVKITGILLNTSLSTTETIIVLSIHIEFRSRVVIVPGELFAFLNSLEEEIKTNSQKSKDEHYSF
jgi:hypothetical protein